MTFSNYLFVLNTFEDCFKVVPNLWSESQLYKNNYFVSYENMKTNYEKLVCLFMTKNILRKRFNFSRKSRM